MTDENEKRMRILLCIWACSYEFCDESLVSDAKFDEMAIKAESTKHLSTGNDALDRWWKSEFSPYTGQWVHTHPELNKLISKTRYVIDMHKRNTQ